MATWLLSKHSPAQSLPAQFWYKEVDSGKLTTNRSVPGSGLPEIVPSARFQWLAAFLRAE